MTTVFTQKTSVMTILSVFFMLVSFGVIILVNYNFDWLRSRLEDLASIPEKESTIFTDAGAAAYIAEVTRCSVTLKDAYFQVYASKPKQLFKNVTVIECTVPDELDEKAATDATRALNAAATKKTLANLNKLYEKPAMPEGGLSINERIQEAYAKNTISTAYLIDARDNGKKGGAVDLYGAKKTFLLADLKKYSYRKRN